MPYGITGPATGSGQGFQGLSQDYLAQAAKAFQNPWGQQMGSMGQGLYGQYLRGTVPAMAQARAAASYRPDMVSSAAVDAQMANDQARGQVTRQLTRMGVNPNSGRFAGLLQEASLAGAANKAGAMTRAEHMERESEFGRLMSAAGLGAGLPGEALSAMSGAGSGTRANAAGLEGIAGQYGSLAAGMAENETAAKVAAANASQAQMDEMLQQLQKVSQDTHARWAAEPKKWYPTGPYGG